MGELGARRRVQSRPRVALATDRLVLRPYEASDLPALEDLVATTLENMRPWMPNATRELSGDLGEWLGAVRELFETGERYPFGLFLKDGTYVGHVTATPEDDGRVEFGYWTHIAHLRRGYMREAVAALIERFAPATFVIHCSSQNPASIGVARTLGFTHVGFRDNGEMRWERVVEARYN